MPAQTCKFFKCLLIACLVFMLKQASAQMAYQNLVFKIDSLVQVGLPKSALKEVDKLDALARREKNAPQMIRAAIYRYNFQSYLQENALVAVIDTLKVDISRADYPVRPVLQSLLADMYWRYYEQNRYNIAGRSKLEHPGTDYRNWDITAIIDEATRLYSLSLQDAEREQNTSLDRLDKILVGDIRTRVLRPTLYDLLLHRAFEFFLAEEPAITKPKLPFSVNDARFFGDSKTFAAISINTTDTASTVYHGIKMLQQAAAFHLQKNDRKALADLNIKRLEFLYEKAVIKNKDSLYLSTLKGITADTAAGIICADALFKIGKYYNDKDSLTMALPYLQQAMGRYPKSPGAQNAGNLIGEITKKNLTIRVEDLNQPDVPLLALLTYKNIRSAHYNIYRLTDAQQVELDKINDHDITPEKKTIAFLKKVPMVQDESITLPLATDLKEHSTEFKINPLTIGNYLLLANQVSAHDSLKQIVQFKVTALASIARTLPDKRREIRIINRETGEPVTGASVAVTFEREEINKYVNKEIVVKGITDLNGAFVFKNVRSTYSVVANYRGDKLLIRHEGYSYEPGYSTPKIEPIAKTVFFTDRQIYRPGQVIYFKVLQLQTLHNTSAIMPKADLKISFKDQNAKLLDSAKLQTNEFGTATAKFTIPLNVLNGWVRLSTPNGSMSVKVEEYKRPTFKLDFEPVTQNYKLGDSITIKGKVNAFSGYGLSGARVALHITRRADIRLLDENVGRRSGRYTSNGEGNAEILADTVKTDQQGNFEIKFKSVGADDDNGDSAYLFSIDASVTDASNETQTAATQIALSHKIIQVEATIPEKVFAKNGAVAAVNIFNASRQLQTGKANVQIYRLQGPTAFFKTRLWDTPDKWLMSKDDYKKYFPFFAYNHEDEYGHWQRGKKVSEQDLDLKKEGNNNIDIEKLLKSPAGVYAVVINAKNETGDTASVTRYINFIADAAPVQKNEDWVLPITTTVRPNEAAEFYVGIGKNCKVLMETYDGPKLLGSQMVALKADAPQKITVPVTYTTDNGFTVQFITINGNRRYSYYQRILVQDTVKPLHIRFLTMRDKLQPGEKEQWKLQIDGSNNKQTSELLAGMYDASLDDVLRPDSWQRSFIDVPYLQPYFQWASDEPSKNEDSDGNQDYPRYYDGIVRDYEKIDMQGFELSDYTDNDTYHGYIENVKALRRKAVSNKKLEAIYRNNARLVKDGYDVVGRVTWRGQPVSGISVGIGKPAIYITTNAYGYFRIKIPENTVLTFKGKGFVNKRIRPLKGLKLIVEMKMTQQFWTGKELMVADPGVKSQEGDPSSDIRIDEPVGSSDIKQVVEEDNAVYGLTGKVSGLQVKGYGIISDGFAAPPMAMMYDELKADPITLREVQIRQGKKFDKELLGRSAREIAQPITIRKNFNETAFFYPQLHTDTAGKITIDFTIPEALTRWKFRSFAHNKELQSGYIEQEVITQKKLMISANMPRFLREGDTLAVSARVVNLSGQKLKGTARLELFNAVTMQPVNVFAKARDAEQPFGLDSSSTQGVSFKLIIPAGLEALTYRVTASAGNYTDGEENTLPILPNSMLVTETMPMMVRAGQTKTFNFDKLVNQTSSTIKSKTLTLEYTQNPAWRAIQSLPYLMEFPYECSEQIFSRYYANSLALNIVNRYPQIKKIFDRWKGGDAQALVSNLDKNPELKSVLLEETPWLQDAISETEQKKQIALLFDLNKATNELEKNILKLYKKQLPDGGFPWFGGDGADRYITQHVLAGIGQLYQLKTLGKSVAIPRMISNAALGYVDKQLKQDELNARKVDKRYLSRNLTEIEMHAWYARSYFTDVKMDEELTTVKKNYMARAASQWTKMTAFNKAMIGLTLYRLGDKETTAAIIKSLLETAQQSDALGMYWADNKSGYYWYQSPVETQSLMIELFTEATNNPKAVDEMKIWLLANKQTNNWRTTKATAAACYALLVKGDDMLSDTGKTSIKLNNTPLADLKPDIKAEAGTGYIKTTWVNADIKPVLGHVQLVNSSKTINWGAMYWQYTERLDKITPSNTNVQLERKYFIQKESDKGPILVAVDAGHQPKTGDVLKVVVYLKADRDFDYIHLKDMRPAGTEPIDALSEYKYQDGLYYYQVSKDVATNFFISQLPKGNYVFEYKLRVVQPGNYATGITSLQSMYAPEFNAHSDGGRMSFKE